jgi:hypothetical protein
MNFVILLRVRIQINRVTFFKKSPCLMIRIPVNIKSRCSNQELDALDQYPDVVNYMFSFCELLKSMEAVPLVCKT